MTPVCQHGRRHNQTTVAADATDPTEFNSASYLSIVGFVSSERRKGDILQQQSQISDVGMTAEFVGMLTSGQSLRPTDIQRRNGR